MGISDLFRPNWKHSDAAVRAKAVRGMDADDQAVLLQIAEGDEDRSIRELAVSRIDDAGALDALAERCAGRPLADQARERASSLRISKAVQGEDLEGAKAALAGIVDDLHLADIVRRAQLEPIRRAALDRLQDERALAEVIRNAKDRALCRSLLERITDAAILRSLALEDQRRELAQAALDRIEDAETLADIAKGAKVKAVRKRAKKRLDAVSAPDSEQQARDLAQKKVHAQLVQLCRTVEKRAQSTDWEATAQAFEEAQARWEELTDQWQDTDEKLAQRFKAVCLGFQTRRDQARAHHAQREAQVVERQAQREEHREERDARTALCEQILGLGGDDVAEELAALQAQWEERGALPESIADELTKRYETAVRQCLKGLERAEDQASTAEALTALLAEANNVLKIRKMVVLRKKFGPLERRWSKVGRGATPEQREAFEELVARFRELEERDQQEYEQRKAENQKRIEALVEQVDKAASGRDLREAERLLKEARATLKKPGPLPSREVWKELRAPLDEAQQKLYVHLQELREADNWQRWANTPRAEELCKKAEGLAEVEDLAEVAKQLRPLQNEWKQVGPVARDQANERWLRFKAACDAAYERCQPYFAEQDTQRKENLEKKEQLCVQVEGLVESTEWNETTDRIKGLQADWKDIGPVPRKQSDAIWKRFRGACDAFFDRRKEHFKTQDAERKVNLEKKATLCERAETLAESSEWAETADKLKGLQAEWKAIGPVPRNKSDAIWSRFRGACDHFFARKKSHLDEGRSENLAQKRELCDALEKGLDGEGEDGPVKPEDLAAQVLETWETWKSIGPIPFDEERPMAERLDGLTARAVETHPAAFQGSALDPEANARRQAELCMQAEVLATQAVERREGERVKLEEQDAESMAAKLREALASNTFKEESAAEDAQRVTDQVTSLRRSLSRVGPVPGDKGRELKERFDKACTEIQGPRKG